MKNKCLGVFLIFLTIPLVMLSILQLSTAKFQQANFYKNLFRQTNSYEKGAKAIPKDTNSDEFLVSLYQGIDGPWLKTNIETNLDEFFGYVNGTKKQANLSLDVRLLKNSLPDGTPAEVENNLPDKLSFDSYKKFIQDFSTQMTEGLAGTGEATSAQDLKAMQDQINQTENLEQQFDQNLANIKKGFFYSRIISYIIYGLTFLMLLFIALASRHYYPAIFRWTGLAIFIPGTLMFLLTFIGQKLMTAFNPLANLQTSPEIKQLVLPLYSKVVNEFTTDIIRYSLVISIIGLVFIIASYVFAAISPEKKLPQAAPAPKPAT